LQALSGKVDTFLCEVGKETETSNGNGSHFTKAKETNNQQKHMDETTSEHRQTPVWSSKTLNMTTKMYSKTNKPDELPERLFAKRNSLLTEMLKISHVRTIRNIFISIMIVLALQVTFNYYTEKGG
jgi:hypothetical protein